MYVPFTERLDVLFDACFKAGVKPLVWLARDTQVMLKLRQTLPELCGWHAIRRSSP